MTARDTSFSLLVSIMARSARSRSSIGAASVRKNVSQAASDSSAFSALPAISARGDFAASRALACTTVGGAARAPVTPRSLASWAATAIFSAARRGTANDLSGVRYRLGMSTAGSKDAPGVRRKITVHVAEVQARAPEVNSCSSIYTSRACSQQPMVVSVTAFASGATLRYGAALSGEALRAPARQVRFRPRSACRGCATLRMGEGVPLVRERGFEDANAEWVRRHGAATGTPPAPGRDSEFEDANGESLEEKQPGGRVGTLERDPEKSFDTVLQELVAIQQDGPRNVAILGTRYTSFLHQQIIELLTYANVLVGNHVFTSGAPGTNAAVIRGALRAEKPDLLTVVLPQSLHKQPAETQDQLRKVSNLIEMVKNDSLPLDIASQLCNSDILSRCTHFIAFAFHDSDVVYVTHPRRLPPRLPNLTAVSVSCATDWKLFDKRRNCASSARFCISTKSQPLGTKVIFILP